MAPNITQESSSEIIRVNNPKIKSMIPITAIPETKYEVNKGKGIERLSNHLTVSEKLFILSSAGIAKPYAMVSRAARKMRFLG